MDKTKSYHYGRGTRETRADEREEKSSKQNHQKERERMFPPRIRNNAVEERINGIWRAT